MVGTFIEPSSGVMSMQNPSRSDVEELVRSFQSCTLPRSQWTHAAHLTVALWYLLHYSQTDAITLIRQGIQRYNAAIGIAATATGGYNETLTLFWIGRVTEFLATCSNRCMGEEVSVGFDPFPELASRLIQTYDDSQLPLHYYSRDRLFSAQARTMWLEPDLLPDE